MRKSMLKQEFSEFRIGEAEGLHKGVHKFEQKAGRKINFDKKESARFNKKKEIRKNEEDSKALITVDTLVDWTNHETDGVIAAKEFGSTRRRSDATSVNKEAIFPGSAGQREETTSRDIPHSKSRRLERMKKIQKP
nr:hypothetical protein [Tanacetum cinerariifolium]